MIRFLYNLLFPFALVLFLPGYVMKMLRRGNYADKFGQRLGFYDRETRRRISSERRTWMHAVSVGEVLIALKLAAAMKSKQPDLHLVLTTTTTTGFALAQTQTPDWVEVIYTPLDFWPAMHAAFALICPARIVLVEAEVWPNLAAFAHQKKIPLALVNARLSPRSEGRFQLFRRLVERTFRKLDLVCVQEPEDVLRWESLGVDAERIRNVGSIKYDPANLPPSPLQVSEVLKNFGIDPARPILLGGSTHPGEEEILGRVFLELRREIPDLFLLIAPRHVERTKGIEFQLRRLGLQPATRSDTKPADKSYDCLLLDTTGELRGWYAAGTIVFIGKSLTAHGGQNPVEAIVADRPVIFGPHMENFARLANSLVEKGGALAVADEAGLTTAAARLLRSASLQAEMIAAARSVLDPHRGATERTADLLKALRSHG